MTGRKFQSPRINLIMAVMFMLTIWGALFLSFVIDANLATVFIANALLVFFFLEISEKFVSQKASGPPPLT